MDEMGGWGERRRPKKKLTEKKIVLVFRKQNEKIESRILIEHILIRETFITDIKRD